MPTFGPLTVATYHLLTTLTGALSALGAGAAAAAAIAVLTIALRLVLLPLTLRQIAGERARAAIAPQLAELSRRHRDDPAGLQRATLELHRAEGVPLLAGIGPALAQMPFFTLLYGVFVTRTIGGQPNALLGTELLGVPLGAHGVAALPVLAILLAALAAVATVSARRALRTGQPRWLGALPYLSVCFAAFTPLAAGIYLLTTTAWSALETAVLRRPATPPSPAPTADRTDRTPR